MKNKIFLLVSLFVLSSCEVDEPSVPEPLSKSYGVVIGTSSIYKSDPNWNPKGTVFLKKSNGHTEIYKDGAITFAVDGQYIVKGPAGEYDRPFNLETLARTNHNGDFIVGFEAAYSGIHESIVKISRINATMIAIKEGIVYKKTFSYSTESIWDIVTGLSSLLVDLNISELEPSIKVIGRRKNTENRYDINSDIILEESTAERIAKTRNNVDDESRSSGKDFKEGNTSKNKGVKVNRK